MKIYVVYGHYCRTQDEAKAHAKKQGGQFIPGADFIEFPTKQGEIVDFLNDLVTGIGEGLVKTLAVEPKPNGNGAIHYDHHIEVEETLEGLPIHRQLEVARIVIENASQYFNTPPSAREQVEQVDAADDLV